MVVAVIDDAKRFKNAKQVGAYAGLTPTQFESGTMSRQGGISGRGNELLRALLVQVSWLARRCNGKISAIFEEVCRGDKTRRKIAVIATARRLLVICWPCSATARHGASQIPWCRLPHSTQAKESPLSRGSASSAAEKDQA